MAKQKLDKETRKAILNARGMVEAVAKADGNEAETRKRVDRIFELVMGYDTFKHISREYAVHGIGDTEHCDFAIQLDNKESAVPTMLVELKRVNIDLVPKHLKQAASYAINIGCEWALLTNGKEWRLYHISFAQPPQTKLIDSWNLISDEPAVLAEKFGNISYKSLRRGYLSKLWEKSNVLTARNILKVILSEESIALIRRQLKKATDVLVSPEDIVGAIRHLLNEAAMTEMSNIKITISEKKQRKRVTVSKSSKEKEKLLAQSGGEDSGH
jgi:predicted type IV restriction endonuclease